MEEGEIEKEDQKQNNQKEVVNKKQSEDKEISQQNKQKQSSRSRSKSKKKKQENKKEKKKDKDKGKEKDKKEKHKDKKKKKSSKSRSRSRDKSSKKKKNRSTSRSHKKSKKHDTKQSNQQQIIYNETQLTGSHNIGGMADSSNEEEINNLGDDDMFQNDELDEEKILLERRQQRELMIKNLQQAGQQGNRINQEDQNKSQSSKNNEGEENNQGSNPNNSTNLEQNQKKNLDDDDNDNDDFSRNWDNKVLDLTKQNQLRQIEQEREKKQLEKGIASQEEPLEYSQDIQKLIKKQKSSQKHKNQQNKSEGKEEEEGNQGSPETEQNAGEDEDDGFDMFNVQDIDFENDNIENNINNNNNNAISDNLKNTESQNWDDNENYLKIRIGEIMNDQYKIISKLGKGVFANVVKAQDINTKEEFAVKILRNEEIMLRAGEKERQILEQLNMGERFHKKHIIKLITSFEYKRHLCLVFELLEMNLRDAIKIYGKGKGLSLDYVRAFGMQLFKGLHHLRKHKIIHSDLKPDNILISKDTKTVKICDLGTAFPIEEIALVEYLESRYYRAPEIIIGYPYDTSIDTWSIGCTLYEMFTGQFLFQGENNNQMLKQHMQRKGKLNNKMLRKGIFITKYFDKDLNFLSKEVDPITKQFFNKQIRFGEQPILDISTLLGLKNIQNTEEYKKMSNFKDLLERTLTLDPKNRITPEEALSHPFFLQNSNINNNTQKKTI